MKIIETIFDNCLVLEPAIRDDSRGIMALFYCTVPEIKQILNDYHLTEQRIYKIKKNAFFGIHKGPSKLISVVHGYGLDYIIDLRQDSATYKHHQTIELDGNTPKIVFVPAGFGHAFLSLADDTIQVFAQDMQSPYTKSAPINYRSPGINLQLPVENLILSDYDRDADMLD
jgi:dTDP-4-dehydrorhamnose 3,5-epimerase